jgi:hypothetical protein
MKRKNLFTIFSLSLILGLAFMLWQCRTNKGVPTEPIQHMGKNLVGRVLDSDSYFQILDTPMGIKGATIKIINGPTVQTNENGYFSFLDIEPGSYNLEISKEGYVTYFLSIKETNFDKGLPNIVLSKASIPVSIGPDGGTITINNTTLVIPKGALSSSYPISITNEVPSGELMQNKKIPLAQIVFTPESLTFSKPAILKIPIPSELSQFDSIGVECYLYNNEKFQWEKKYFNTRCSNDTIIILIDHFSRYIFLFGGYIEWDFTDSWNPDGPETIEEAEHLVGSLCCGKGQTGTIPGPSITLSKQITVGGAIGWRDYFEFSIGWEEGWSETITCPSLNVGECQCCELYATLYKQIMKRHFTWRFCDIITAIPGATENCTPWYNGVATKVTYRYAARPNCSPNNTPECHDQGGGQ